MPSLEAESPCVAPTATTVFLQGVGKPEEHFIIPPVYIGGTGFDWSGRGKDGGEVSLSHVDERPTLVKCSRD